MLATLAGAAAALGGAIIGGINSAKANNQARRLLQQQRNENKRWYDTKMNQDYTQRTDIQQAINKQRELLDEQLKRSNANKVVGGGSDESAALAKEAANKSLADATAQIAAAGAEYKDQVEKEYRANDAALNQQEIQNYQNQAAQTAQAASQAVNAGIGLIGTDEGGLGLNLNGKATQMGQEYLDSAAQQAGLNVRKEMSGISNPTQATLNVGGIPKPKEIKQANK